MSIENEMNLLSALAVSMNNEDLLLAVLQGLIAAEISMKRQELNMSQKAFAEKMNVSQGLVSRWENGETNFTLQTLVKICMALDLNMQSPIVPKQPKKYAEKGSNLVFFNRLGGGWSNLPSSQETGNNYKVYESEDLEEM